MRVFSYVGNIRIEAKFLKEKPWLKGLAAMQRNKSLLMRQFADELLDRVMARMYTHGFKRRTGLAGDSVEVGDVTENGFGVYSDNPKAYQLEHGTTESGDTVIKAKSSNGMLVPFLPEVRYSSAWMAGQYNRFQWGDDYFVAQEVKVPKAMPFVAPVFEEMIDSGFVAQLGAHLFEGVFE